MMWPLVPLAIGALFAGIAFHGDFVGPRSEGFWNGSLYSAGAVHEAAAAEVPHEAARAPAATEEAAAAETGAARGEAHHPPLWVVLAPFVAMLIGLGLAANHYLRGDPLRPGVLKPGGMIYEFIKNKWYFDEIYDFLFVRPAFAFGRFLWKSGDGETIDGVGPDGFAAAVAAGAKRIVRIQTGYMYHYAFVMLIGIAVLITYVLIRTGGGQ
jgi:NADH-quinone oxidoreductase subunit L